MSQGDQWENEFEPQKAAPAAGLSTGVKVLLGIAIAAGLCMLLCCGGLVWFWSQAIEVVPTADGTQAIAKEIAEIDIPESLELPPRFGVRLNMYFATMKIAFFGDMSLDEAKRDEAARKARRMLMLAEVSSPQDPERQMRQTMRQQNQGARDLNIQETEEREYEVRGETVSFRFEKGTDRETGEAFRQVTGTFPGKSEGSFGMLFLQIVEEEYEEDAVEEMIKSIK